MNKNYLLSLSKGKIQGYLTMSNQRGQTRIMCFENKKDALRCKDYVVNYKQSYGHWPSLDMSAHSQTIEYKNEKIENNAVIHQKVELEEIDSNKFDHYINNMHMSFLLCTSFNTIYEGNKHHLDFTGSEIVCDDTNLYNNVTQLNRLYEEK